MTRLARGLAAVARRTGVIRRSPEGQEHQRRSRVDWRWPLDEALLRRLERAALAPRQPAAGGLGGEHRSRARAASTDFADYRPYLPGDDFRQIDWNVYSRLDQLFVRQTEARERLPVHLLLDCSASMAAGRPSKLDYARQLAATLGYVALARYDRLELVWFGDSAGRLRPLRGRQRFADLLAALDTLSARGSLVLDSALASFRPSGVAGHLVLLSDFLDPSGYERGLNLLAKTGLELNVIQVLSREEVEPEAGGDFELEDVESGERLEVGLSPQAVAVYRARLGDWCGALERHCAARGWRFLQVTTDEPLERVVLVKLRQAGMLS